VYKVIRWVKSIPYLYEQISYRFGKSVKTKAWYMGRATADDVQKHGKKKDVKHRHSTQDITQTRKQSAGGFGDSAKVITTKNYPLIQSKINIEGHGIEEHEIIDQWYSFVRQFEKSGLDTSDLPIVKLDYGETLGYKKSLIGNSYVVTMPLEGKVDPREYKNVFSSTMARIGLDLLQTQRPEDYLKLATRFNESFWVTQHALCTFLQNTRDRKMRAKAYALLIWGNIAQFQNIIPEEKEKSYGIVDLSKRGNWKDEFASVMGYMQTTQMNSNDGFKAVVREIVGKLSFAQTNLEKAKIEYKKHRIGLDVAGHEFLNPYRAKAKKKLLRTDARVRSLEELRRKIGFIRTVFYQSKFPF
jgi:hypothetical protein